MRLTPKVFKVILYVTTLLTTLIVAVFFITNFIDSTRFHTNNQRQSAENNYYTIENKAQHPYEALGEGSISYCDLDSLGRPTCAYGLLTTDMRKAAKARGRQKIEVNPTGWPAHNQKVTITDGSQSYTGWFWNRSHMIADSLGGDPVKGNLVTGTRTQNVGISSAHNGGMAYSETKARSYLDNQAHASCPLYYAVTPNYNGNELIPRTVTVDMESCDKSISEHITVPNTANGWTIDYNTAEISH